MHKQLLIIFLAATILVLIKCGPKSETRGIVAGPIVTMHDIRKDPESFLGKQICFYADTSSTSVSEGYDFADTSDKVTWLDWPGQKGQQIESYLRFIKDKIPFEIAELGHISLYFDCKLPVHLLDRGVDTSLNYLPLFKPDEYLKKGDKMPHAGRKADCTTVLQFNLPKTLFSGYVFESAAYYCDDSLGLKVERLSGKKVYGTIISVFLTGFKTQ